MTDGTQLSVITNLDETPFPWNLREGQEAAEYADAGMLRSIGLLPDATAEHRAGVMLHMVDKEGYNVVAQTTFRLLNTAWLTMMATPWMQEQIEEDGIAKLMNISDVHSGDDPWDTPGIEQWARRVRTDMLPKLTDSEVALIIVTPKENDVKLAVEVGFSLLLDKPIVAICFDGAEPSEKLRKIADEVISLDMTDLTASRDAVTGALQRLMDRGLIRGVQDDYGVVNVGIWSTQEVPNDGP